MYKYFTFQTNIICRRINAIKVCNYPKMYFRKRFEKTFTTKKTIHICCNSFKTLYKMCAAVAKKKKSAKT